MDLASSGHPGGAELLRRHRAHGIEHAHVPVDDEVHKVLRRADLEIPVRLFLLARGLCRRLGIGDADRAGETDLLARPALDRLRDLARGFPVAGGLGEIEIRLIQRDGLRRGRVGLPDLVQLPHVNALRAEPVGVLDVHARAHAEGPRLIAAGGHHAALMRQRADDQRLSAQGGVVPHLHGGEKRVHVHMQNDLFRLSRLPAHFFSLYRIAKHFSI